MNIIKDKMVTIIYELKVDGEVIEQVKTDDPLSFVFGNGEMLDKFEENLANLESGSKFDFKIDLKDAYGKATTEYILDVPKDEFKNEEGLIEKDLLTIGNMIPMLDNEENVIDGLIVNVGKEKVTLDFNHPLAGEDLFFIGEIIEVRDATQDEIDEINNLDFKEE